MKHVTRTLLRLAIAATLFFALLRLWTYASDVVARELYDFADRLGLRKQSTPLGLALTIRFVATFLGTGIGACAGMMLYRRLASRASFYRQLRIWRGWRSLILANLVFSAVMVPVTRYVPTFVQECVLRAGEGCGCTVIHTMGRLMIGPSGPFAEGELRHVFNALWRWLPALVALLPPFVLAVAVDRRLTRDLALPGRCRRCDYDLAENRTGVCPECGAKLRLETGYS